jgi:hypothetical protein
MNDDAFDALCKLSKIIGDGAACALFEYLGVDSIDIPQSDVFLRICKLVGVEKACILFKRYKGGKVYVPQKIRDTHTLSQLLGLETAQILVKEFGASYIKFPLCHGRGKNRLTKNERIKRNEKIKRLVRQRMPLSKISREVGISERSITFILGKSPSLGNYYYQPSIF